MFRPLGNDRSFRSRTSFWKMGLPASHPRPRHTRLALEALERRLLLSCSTPRTETVRGKSAEFDQCYNLEFSQGGTDYEVSAYYVEEDTAANLAECDADENLAGRCEHALPDVDNGDGDNVHAVSMAMEARDAFKFYLDRNLKFVPAGVTELEVFIAEDPRGGGVPTANSLLTDDELVASADDAWEKLLAYHELHHLVQNQYDPSWKSFYGEGIARSIEDRVLTSLDIDTGHLFIPQINNALTDDGVRSSDLEGNSYDTAAWWTWLWDQYRVGAAENPPVGPAADIGWQAIRDFYIELESQPTNELGAVADFVSAQGSSFRQDFIDYTLALYAYEYNPSDPRLGFIDAEINAQSGLSGHTVINSAPAFGEVNMTMNPRSSRYIEFNPASQCDYTAFTFDGNGKSYGFSVMTVDGGNLQDRWTSYSNTWARTVRTADLDRMVGVVTAFDQSGSVDVGRGCVSPSVNIKSPTTSSFVMVGTADNPRSFIVRTSVTGGGAPIAGLVADEFEVTLTKSAGGPAIEATVINASYVLDDYWLLVQAPDDMAGGETGSFYDLTVNLGGNTDSEAFSVVYLERVQDVMIVLDRSGSMGGTTGKIEAAQNAANLFVNTLTDDDQGSFVAFDTNAQLRVSLDELGNGSQRTDLENAIAAEVPLDFTSIGDGMRTALNDYLMNGEPTNMCSFVLLSDGHENEPEFWSTVAPDIVDAGCPVHTISLGPGANEVLMQQISGTVSGGTHDYATTMGGVPINSTLGWENNLSRVYDNKATEIAGRERILTALADSATGGVNTGIVDFEDQPLGTVYTVGDKFVASGVPGKAKTFFFRDGTPTNNGFARVERQGDAGGSGHDVMLNNISMGFDFENTLDQASLLFGYFGGNINLDINGELLNVASLTQLQGAVVGGVSVSLTMFDNQHGRFDFKGPIDSICFGGQEMWMDSLRFNGREGNFHEIPVSSRDDVLVVATAWHEGVSGAHTMLIQPDGNMVPVGQRRMSSQGTNEVWHVPDPMPGIYRLQVKNLPQEYFLTASVRSEFELYTFVGTPLEDMIQGVEVPLVASFIASDKPVTGAMVTATVMDPQGTQSTVILHDDGNHGDGVADDGIYANSYTATSIGDLIQPDPDLVEEGNEPQGVGSYQVSFLAVRGDVRREGLGSFVINQDRDSDDDGVPDRWEIEHGLDPKDREDANSDHDMDGLPARCEFIVGTDPRNSDTDGGGESDGSEVLYVPGQVCRAVRDPLNPRDDRARPLSSFLATAQSTLAAGPFVELSWGVPSNSDYLFATIMRHALDDSGSEVEPWRTIAEEVRPAEFIDRQVEARLHYQYKVMPVFGKPDDPVAGRVILSNHVMAQRDPYAPTGSILINEDAARTTSPFVTLNIMADDSGLLHDFDLSPPAVPGSPLRDLQMRLNNSPDFRGVPWVAYRPVVEDWYIGDTRPGNTATVYVQFMDEAENISEDLIADSILAAFVPGDTHPFDGVVNINDLNNVRNTFGAIVRPGRGGDAIGSLDGRVNIDDLNLVRNNFGAGTPALAVSATRPEETVREADVVSVPAPLERPMRSAARLRTSLRLLSESPTERTAATGLSISTDHRAVDYLAASGWRASRGHVLPEAVRNIFGDDDTEGEFDDWFVG